MIEKESMELSPHLLRQSQLLFCAAKTFCGIVRGSALIVATVLVGCSDTSTEANLRLVNATNDIESIQLVVEEKPNGVSVKRDSVGQYQSIEEGLREIEIRRQDSTRTIFKRNQDLVAERSYAAVAFGSGAGVSLLVIAEDEERPDAGGSKISVLHSAEYSGALDVYVLEQGLTPRQQAPVVDGLTFEERSSFETLDAGTYRLLVTGTDEPEDIRLEVVDFALPDEARVNLIVQPGISGVLTNTLALEEEGALRVISNTMARARLVNNIEGDNRVSARIAETNISTAQSAPSVSEYTAFPAAGTLLTLDVSGARIEADFKFEPTTDYSLVVYGPSTSPAIEVLVDDNNSSSEVDSTIRLLNALNDKSQPRLTLTLDFDAIGIDVPVGRASVYSSFDPTNADSLEITVPGRSDPIFTRDELNLANGSVYSVIVLGNLAEPSVLIRRDR